ncbi:MAG: hypothetical protein IKV94_03650 [Clostridia bacterium]|nr:hypothetical protein [Clostridia bacterium]
MLIITFVVSFVLFTISAVHLYDWIDYGSKSPFGRKHIKKWLIKFVICLLIMICSVVTIIVCNSSTLINTSVSEFVIKQTDSSEYIVKIYSEHVICLSEDNEIKKLPIKTTEVIETSNTGRVLQTAKTYKRDFPNILRNILLLSFSEDNYSEYSYIVYIDTSRIKS